MNRKQVFALLLGAAVSACSSEASDRSTPPAAVAENEAKNEAADSMPVMDSTTAAHAGHAMPTADHAATHAPAGHAQAAGAVAHGGKHVADAPMQHGGKHVADAPMQHAGEHVAATPMKHDSTHAMAPQHDMSQNRDTTRGHDMTQHRDTAKHDNDAPNAAHAAHDGPRAAGSDMQHGMSDMLMTNVGPFTIMGMAQIFPTVTVAMPRAENTPLGRTGLYLTQPAAMINVSSPNERWVLRTTLNFEGITQPEGELTFGGWGEGFLDKRHPHTLLHEFMLSWNTGTAWRGASISAGKGFAPYGTDDPMSRPILKYPTNHHLSQALERWTLSGALGLGQWGLEASVFGGQEPVGPYDLSNIESFGDSWSARVTKRFGNEALGSWPWELSASYANIAEEHDGVTSRTNLYNTAIRHDHSREKTPHYTLVEYSISKGDDSYFSLLGETAVTLGRHQPYGRVEFATRPEFERMGPPSSEEFFRYDHDSHAIGATRWLIATGGYGFVLGRGKVSPRPYIEAQYNRVRAEDGGIDPNALFGRSSFWSLSAGVRVLIGGEAMRMGRYGIFDPMTAMSKMPGAHDAHTSAVTRVGEQMALKQ